MGQPRKVPVIDVESMVIDAAKRYAHKLKSAPSRSTYVFGQRVPTKRDAENVYKQELKGYLALATQFGDMDACDLITSSLTYFDKVDEG
tara:strand:+ start:203 stop:469 length:267 start_codon:yes stop_codon:yes gene_type:complete